MRVVKTVSQELADVTIYAIRLATVCDVIEPLKVALLKRSE